MRIDTLVLLMNDLSTIKILISTASERQIEVSIDDKLSLLKNIVNKDLILSGIEPMNDVELLDFESFINSYIFYLKKLVFDENLDLQNYLYRVDISESHFQFNTPTDVEDLAFLVLKRELQKVLIRIEFG